MGLLGWLCVPNNFITAWLCTAPGDDDNADADADDATDAAAAAAATATDDGGGDDDDVDIWYKWTFCMAISLGKGNHGYFLIPTSYVHWQEVVNKEASIIFVIWYENKFTLRKNSRDQTINKMTLL